MQNFTLYNPTKLVFGKDTISELSNLVPNNGPVLMAYGGGSIKKNGVYDQVIAALPNHQILEFAGIEPNPRYETCLRAAELIKANNVAYILAVGGGSVLDATKFISAAACWEEGDPWDIFTEGAPVTKMIPWGSVLTLPATGSEMNCATVISRDSTNEKRAIMQPLFFPDFSILDPETTKSLPRRQVINGIVDTYAHVLEQYMTYPVNTPLQDRQAEAILLTLVEEGPKVLENPDDYDIRANLMWCATQALTGPLSCGVVIDWATHMIGHELTALYGLDHAQTLAVVFPALLRHESERKAEKLLQYGERIFGITQGTDAERIAAAIDKTEEFFKSIGIGTRLKEYDVTEGVERVGARLEDRGAVLGEHRVIDRKAVDEILELAAE
jgi:NADP-dependent alcohol dehydrogenase